MTTETKTAIAIGSDEIQRKAASDANAVQDGVNIVAIVGSFHRHLLALHGSGIRGDCLIIATAPPRDEPTITSG